VSNLGSECKLVGGILLRNGSLSLKDLVQNVINKTKENSINDEIIINEDLIKTMCRNTHVILIKNNLVKAWQSELDLITYFTLDE
jgi:hypothetical protein